jgi:putative DNA primase/helicase
MEVKMSKKAIVSKDEAIIPVAAVIQNSNEEYITKASTAPIAAFNKLIEDKPTGENHSINDEATNKLIKADTKELMKMLDVSEQDILEEHNEFIESTAEALATLEPPVITPKDTDYFNTRQSFGLPSAFYPYKDVMGVVIGYMVRWDIRTASGATKKEVRPYIYDFAIKQWKSKFFGGGLPNSRPLYNLPEIAERPDATVMIVEGEKTAEAAKSLFPDFVAITSSGGANQAKNTDWQHLRGRDIIFCPDAGEAGEGYLKSVVKELRRVGAKVSRLLEPSKLSPYAVQNGIFLLRQNEVPKGYDLADSLADGWTTELIKQAQSSKEFEPFFKELTRTGVLREEPKQDEEFFELGGGAFKLSPVGLYRQYFVASKAEDFDQYPDSGYSREELAIGVHKEVWQPLCGYLKPTHEVRDSDNSWGMLVKFKDMNNTPRETFLKRTDWLGEKGAVEILQDQGLRLLGLKKHKFDFINEYLNEFKPEFKAVGVDMVGWQDDLATYILPFTDDPRNSYTCTKDGEQKVEYILQQKGVVTRSLRKKGTLAEWQRTVGAVCKGNHLHTFAILTALTAPALKLLNEEGGFIHYAGNTSIGKSTILHVAKSVWGFENLGSFRATDNSLESTCKNSNDGMLFLDEIGEIEPEALDKVIYMLANGATKGRSDRSGNAKAATHFKVLAQCTGEMGLAAKLAEKNKKAKGGQLIRMAELDADRGKGLNTFDILNINPDTGELFVTGREQAEYLKLHASKNCGVVIDGFLKEASKDIEGFTEDLEEAKAKWLERKFTGNEGVEVSRMAKRFSTIYASAVMAVEFGVVPFSIEEIEDCVNAMFDNWLERFGGDSSYELKTMIDDLHKLCIEQQHSRFCNTQPEQEERVNLPREKAGYWHKEKNEFWISPKVFEREVLKGKDRKVFYPLLVKEGYLKKEEDMGYETKRQPKRESRQRFIVVSADTLLGECD